MRLSSVFTNAMPTFGLAAIAVLGFSSFAQALTFSGSSTGTWGKPIPGSINTNPVYPKDVVSNIFTWGKPNVAGTSPNKLIFEGNSFAGNVGSLFKLGELTYFNGTVDLGTSVESVPLNLLVSLTDPVAKSEVFNFDFRLENTINSPDIKDDASADSVVVINNFGERNFIFDDQEYTIELTGFRKEGQSTDTSKFSVKEGETTRAALYGRMTTRPLSKKVPEPSAIAGFCALSIYLITRKKFLKV